VLIPEPLTGKALERLAERFDVKRDEGLHTDMRRLVREIEEREAVIVRNQTQLTAEVIGAARKLRVIGRCGVGLDNVDVEAASAKGVVVCYAPEANAASVAEITLGAMLCLARKIVSADRSVKDGQWDRSGHVGIEIRGKTLGVLGLGCIGTIVAFHGRALGMNVIAHHRSMNHGHAAVTEAGAVLVGLDELIESADFLAIHLPLTDETRGMIDSDVLRRMKPTAYLINTSRGGIVVEDDLYRALRDGRIAGAALDVREKEPPGSSPLHGLDNVLLTPHIAGFTDDALERVADTVVSDVIRVLQGQSAIHFASAGERSVPG